MDKKTKNSLIVSIIGLALVLIGTTFAYFGARITGLESASTIRLTAGTMGIEYSEGDGAVIMNNIYPREEAWFTKTITLTAHNTTDKPMEYELGFRITNNTFLGGQLTFSLTGEGSNGTRIADITSKALVGHDRFLKIGKGSFASANGDTHTYTINIYFKDTGKNQNINQGAVFNAKIEVGEPGLSVASANQNHNGAHCYTDDYVAGVTPADGKTYTKTSGQYTYTYNYAYRLEYDDIEEYYYLAWGQINQDGWSVKVTNPNSTDPINEEFCAYINEKPVVSMIRAFKSCKATSIDVSSFDTSHITSMFEMFYGAIATEITGLNSFDTSNVTDMNNMFYYTNSSIDISSFDTSNVTDMSNMFGTTTGTIIGLDKLDTSSVTNMTFMFRSSHASTLDVSNFDTSNVTHMTCMFDSPYITDIIGLTSFDTSNVRNISSMFRGASVSTLDLSSFDIKSVGNITSMFDGATNLTTIYASNDWTSDNNISSQTMFNGCTSLVGGAGTVWSASNRYPNYAHIDEGPSNPGYFTSYLNKPSN